MASKPEKPQTKANKFVIRLAEGMAGWASFAQAAKMSPIYSESLIYLPIFQLAKGRNWKTRPQKKLVKSVAGRGKNKTVDFVFQSEDRDIGIFLEAKFVRYSAKHCLQITKDIHKLISLTAVDISEKAPPTNVYKYILLIGRENDINGRIKRRVRKIADLTLKRLKTHEDERLLVQIGAALKNVDRNSTSTDDWAFPGLGARRWRYWAVLLREKSWWSSLASLGKLSDVPDDDEEEAEADDLARIDSDVQDEES